MTKPANFETAFNQLKSVFDLHIARLSVKENSSAEFTVHTKSASPFPQHKDQPMFFGSVRIGKAYVSFHLMPLYMNASLTKTISPALKKRMQGKTCFNFKNAAEPDVLSELQRLTDAGVKQWTEMKWL
jgi:hypothetical protein